MFTNNLLVSKSVSSVATATDTVPEKFNEEARWNEVTPPYVLATGITVEEYEQLCIGAIIKEINKRCSDADGTNDFPWPNLVVEVAYTETLDHVEEALKYWLSPGHAHDCIIVKIDPVPQGQVPVRMRAWYYFIEDRKIRNTIPYRTMVMLDYPLNGL
ncbi:5029_t:CDS:2 [Diversispora eburnea]|uniref:5029_t:CDS:1 n=1 Tax=Diversispora eburnea TaxID=1213867 RepID=A0A9N8VEF4_9GLOM|nr:5029_t:CDS:2 [Diversispora eburnea]